MSHPSAISFHWVGDIFTYGYWLKGEEFHCVFFAVILRHVAPRAAAPTVTNTMEQLLIYVSFYQSNFYERFLMEQDNTPQIPTIVMPLFVLSIEVGRSVVSINLRFFSNFR